MQMDIQYFTLDRHMLYLLWLKDNYLWPSEGILLMWPLVKMSLTTLHYGLIARK